MAEYLTTDTDLQSVADAIRAKGKTSAQLVWPAGYNAAINAINPLTLSVNTFGPSSIVTVNDATDLDAKQVVVDIEPVQAGSGDPSPTNVRPITGWTGAHIYVSLTQDAQDGSTYSITFPSSAGTVYGGTLDVTNGVLTVDRAMVTFNGGSSEQWWLAHDYTNRFGNNKTGTFCDGIVEHQISNWLKSSSWGNTSFTFGLRSDGSLYICLDASAEQITEAQFRAYLASTPLQIVYTLATPVTYNLTPQDIELLSGYNVIFADCGDVALSYYTEDFDDLADEIGFAEGGDY